MGRRVVRSAAWSFAGTVGAKALGIPVSFLLARLMGPAGYGEFGVVISSVDLFGAFAGFGLSLTATKYVAELKVRDPARAGRVLALSNMTAAVSGAAFAILVYVLAPWLAGRYLAAPNLANPLRIGGLLLFFGAVNGAQAGGLAGFEAFRAIARIQCLSGLLNIPLSLGGFYLAGLEGILVGSVVGGVAEWCLKQCALRSEAQRAGIPVLWRDATKELAVLRDFSVPAVMAGIMVAPANWVCSAILVNQANGYAEMGVYNAAGQWYRVLLFLPLALGSGLLPILSDRLGGRDSKMSAELISFMMRLNAVIALPLVLGIAAFSPYIMRAYGARYSAGWPTLIAVLATAGIYTILMPVGDVIVASGRMWLGFVMNLAWAVVFIGMTCFLGHWGSFGLSVARLIAYAFHGIWTLAFARGVVRGSTMGTEARQYSGTLRRLLTAAGIGR